MKKPPFAETYTGRLRAKFGSGLLLMPSARIVVENAQGEILCIRRADDGFWALPAGLAEAGESITECAVRRCRRRFLNATGGR